MKKLFVKLILAFALCFLVSITVFAQHIYVGPETEKIITYDENGNKVITLIFDPSNAPKDFQQYTYISNENPPENEDLMGFEKIPALTEAPQVGTKLGHILDENADPSLKGSGRFMESYQSGMIGQCTWYAAGRFREVYGIELPYMGSAKNWIENAYKSNQIKTTTDFKDVPVQAIAVFEPTEEYSDWPGHVSFIEFVQYENGKVTNVYYTDANGSDDICRDTYNSESDGTVKVRSYEEFTEPNGLKLIGYILPKDN